MRLAEFTDPTAVALVDAAATPLANMVKYLRAVGWTHDALVGVLIWRPPPESRTFWDERTAEAQPFVASVTHGEGRAVVILVPRVALVADSGADGARLSELISQSVARARAILPASEVLPLLVVDGTTVAVVPMHFSPSAKVPAGAPS